MTPGPNGGGEDGGVTFGPRASTIDMRDFGTSTTSIARPWLSVCYNGTPSGMADVDGGVLVVTPNASMCMPLKGHSVNVTVHVECKVV